MADRIDISFLHARIAELEGQTPEIDLKTSGGDSTSGGMRNEADPNERLSRLEGAVEGLRHSQNILGVAFGIFAAVVFGGGIYALQRIDSLSDKVIAMPDKISGDLRELTNTLSAAITASKQQAPQVLLIPAPQPTAPTPEKRTGVITPLPPGLGGFTSQAPELPSLPPK